MTADELKKLAEIAGFVLTDPMGNEPLFDAGYYKDRKLMFKMPDWQPHLRIEQAMMVAEAFPAFYLGKDNGHYFCRIAIPNSKGIKYLQKSHSTILTLAICRAALAAKEG